MIEISDAHIPCPAAVSHVNKFVGNNNAFQVLHAFITNLIFYP